MDSDLTCNYKKCRNRLSSFAWVTSCSHIFCDEDGTREFNKSYACPACEHDLSGKFDIIRTDLSPSDQYKSMVLAGQKPEVIMEICARALSFWTYQAHQERTYHEYLSSKSKERCLKLEQYYEQVLARLQSEISSLKSQVTTAKQELASMKSRYNECSSKLLERNRHYQKLQSMYDVMRRRTVTASSFGSADTVPRLKTSLAPNFSMPLQHASAGMTYGNTPPKQPQGSRPDTVSDQDFQFRPQTEGTSGSSFSGFRLPTPPPGMLDTPHLPHTGAAGATEISAGTSADMQAKFTLNLTMPGQQMNDVVEPKRL